MLTASIRVGRALASPGGRNPPVTELCRFNSCPTHLEKSRVECQARTGVCFRLSTLDPRPSTLD